MRQGKWDHFFGGDGRRAQAGYDAGFALGTIGGPTQRRRFERGVNLEISTLVSDSRVPFKKQGLNSLRFKDKVVGESRGSSKSARLLAMRGWGVEFRPEWLALGTKSAKGWGQGSRPRGLVIEMRWGTWVRLIYFECWLLPRAGNSGSE